MKEFNDFPVEALSLASHVDEAGVVNLAKELISVPSLTMMESDVMDFIKKLFEQEGIEYEIQEVEKGRPQIIGRIRGSGGGRSLMFNGHLDIDPVPGSWESDPYIPVVDGNKLWGHGIHNMKSGVAAMLYAAIIIKRANVPLKGDLIIACVVGELQGGKGTVHMLKQGIVADMAIVPEPYSIDRIITKCVGVHKCAITTIGRYIHTSRSNLGVDAIGKMFELYPSIKNINIPIDDPDIPGLPLINIGTVIGGRGNNYDLGGISNLADRCTVLIDVRYAGNCTSEEIDRTFCDMLDQRKKEDPDFEYEYHHPIPENFGVGGTDMPPTNVDSNTEIALLVEGLHNKILNQEIKERGVALHYSYCGNDTAHLEKAGIPCCLYGPRGYSSDGDEVEKYVRIDEMVNCSKVLVGAAITVCS